MFSVIKRFKELSICIIGYSNQINPKQFNNFSLQFLYNTKRTITSNNNSRTTNKSVYGKEGDSFYYDYVEDLKILKKIKKNEIHEVLNIKEDKNILQIKKKYLNMLKIYHPDNYINEKNETRKKNKEDIFLHIYNEYKKITQNDHFNDSQIYDEIIEESEENPDERLERYKRYAEGKRNDVDIAHSEVYILITIFLIFSFIFWLCLHVPFDGIPDKEQIYESTEHKKIEIISCFYNPVLRRYEYFLEPHVPPSPQQLYHFYKNTVPNLSIDDNILNMKHFEVIKLPKNKAKKARLIFDKDRNELIYLKKKKLEIM